MTPLPLLLRDSALAACVFAIAGQLCGHGVGVAAGTVAGTLNLLGLVWAVAGSPAGILGRLAAKQLAAVLVMYLVFTRCEPGPAMVGMLAPLAGITARTLLGMRQAQPPASPTSTFGVER